MFPLPPWVKGQLHSPSALCTRSGSGDRALGGEWVWGVAPPGLGACVILSSVAAPSWSPAVRISGQHRTTASDKDADLAPTLEGSVAGDALTWGFRVT